MFRLLQGVDSSIESSLRVAPSVKSLTDGATRRLDRPGFHYTTNATTTTQKQSDYKVEQSSFTLMALF